MEPDKHIFCIDNIFVSISNNLINVQKNLIFFYQLYWNYLLDLFSSLKSKNQPLFAHTHLSTLTHDWFNHAGYADAPYHAFLSKLFAEGHHKNSVILLYADHSLRFGPVLNTTSSVYENRLPFFYIYVPDSLSLDGPLGNAT